MRLKNIAFVRQADGKSSAGFKLTGDRVLAATRISRGSLPTAKEEP
jgi:hypothetical protein